MFDQIELVREFFEGLTAVDETIVARVAAAACPFCGGPLHRGDYPRKPRGGLVAVAAEAFRRRFSLCCGREGCRRRATPPSVRFLGRRVYVAAVVIVASVVALAAATASAVRRVTGIAPRTARRWLQQWRGPFPGDACVSCALLGAPRTRHLARPAAHLRARAPDVAPPRHGSLDCSSAGWRH